MRPARAERIKVGSEPAAKQGCASKFVQRSAASPTMAAQRFYDKSPAIHLPAIATIQRKMRISQPGDSYEEEADRVAERVMRMPDATLRLQRKCACGVADAPCEPCANSFVRVQRRAMNTGETQSRVPSIVHDALRSPGEALDSSTRDFMETRFGHDFSHVRVHTDTRASESALSVNSLAYTVGPDIVFGQGRYAPNTTQGKLLLAHELAHVIQQSTSAASAAGAVRSDHVPQTLSTLRHAPKQIARQPRPGASASSSASVSSVRITRNPDLITFSTSQGPFSYDLINLELQDGEYDARVQVSGVNVSFTIESGSGEQQSARFQYRIRPGQPNPSTFFRGQNRVHISVAPANQATSSGPHVLAEIPVFFSGTETLLPGFGNLASTSLYGLGAELGGDFPSPPIQGIQSPYLPGYPLSVLGLGGNVLASGSMAWLTPRAGVARVLSPAYWSPLIPQSGVTPLDRILNTIPRDLGPKLETELAERAAALRAGRPQAPLAWTGRTFQPDPLSPVTRNFTEAEILGIQELVARFNVNPASLTTSELQLLREAASIHIGGSSPGSPFASYMQPNFPLESVGQRQFRVRVEVQNSNVLDVSVPNEFNQRGANQAITNVEEAEFLVTASREGRIIAVERISGSVEPGFLMRNAGMVRWGGRVLLVAGFAVSGYRIATASPQERPVVVGEEVGGQAGGFAGMGLGTAACIFFGIATEGIGLFLCGLAGGIGGGVLGSMGGGAAARSLQAPRNPSVSFGHYCFTADTRILMSDRSLKPISQIKVGEQVLGFDERRGRVTVAEVTHTQRHTQKHYIALSSADGSITLKVTRNHPLYSSGKWIPAGDIHGGQPVAALAPNDESLSATTLSQVADGGGVDDVFNLTVGGVHTYFAEGILAHNKMP